MKLTIFEEPSNRTPKAAASFSTAEELGYVRGEIGGALFGGGA
jgi:hypothetical protein